MCDEMHPAQDTSAWLILLESWGSQLYRGVSHFLSRKFCEKWKLQWLSNGVFLQRFIGMVNVVMEVVFENDGTRGKDSLFYIWWGTASYYHQMYVSWMLDGIV